MVRINLLPWRAELREKRKKEFQTRAVLAGLLGAVAVFAGFMYLNNELSEQEQVNQMIVAENAKLDEQLKSLEGLDIRRQQIIERMKLIEGLQGQRPVIVRLADELVRVTPSDMYITKFAREGDKFAIEGQARDPQVVAELLRGLENSPWFRNAFMNSFVASNEAIVNFFTNHVNARAAEEAKTNPEIARQMISVVQRPEISYGRFQVTVDLDDVSKSTAPTDSNVAVGTANSQATPAQPAPANDQAAPAQPAPANDQAAPAQPAPTNGQAAPAQPAPANGQAAPAQPAPANGQAASQSTPPANNQGAK